MSEWVLFVTLILIQPVGDKKPGDVLGTTIVGASPIYDGCREASESTGRALADRVDDTVIVIVACVQMGRDAVDAIAKAQGWETAL